MNLVSETRQKSKFIVTNVREKMFQGELEQSTFSVTYHRSTNIRQYIVLGVITIPSSEVGLTSKVF